MEMACLICAKLLKVDEDRNIDGGGEMQIRFDFGSRHDQLGSYYGEQTPLEKILGCDEIMAVICDDCFENEVFKHCAGFKVQKKTEREMVITPS